MRVKRLEIQGFKSFKDKTVIHFDKSITGIVGPNGCGKSNIVDAFFWVMGEQSYKHMRGSGSSDLIFNGSAKYSPLGYAEATLVLETDVVDTENAPAGASAGDLPVPLKSKDISVTRRVYRTGEGEYFINGIQSRLKDIHELFMDTGVGAKGYSVIEQGQIAKIVNAKPDDRRVLVEEAAGIAKYKARKRETYRRLESTRSNLSRLNDVVQEIERNLGSLERQAAKARRYKDYKEQLFDKEMTWGRRKYQVLQYRDAELKKEREASEQELLGIRSELEVQENQLETNRVKQVTDGKTAEDLQAKVHELSETLTEEKSALQLSRQRQEDLERQLSSMQTERSELEQTISSEKEQLENRESQMNEIESEFEKAAQEAGKKDEEINSSRLETDSVRKKVEEVKSELLQCISDASELTSRSASMMAKSESCEEQYRQLEERESDLKKRVEQAKLEVEMCQSTARELLEKRNRVQSEKSEVASQTESAENELKAAESRKEDLYERLTQKKSRLESLEQLAAANEGLANGPKSLIEWGQSAGKSKAFTLLADLIEVESEYQLALEGWLEEKLQNLVSDDFESAMRGLNTLREQKSGRAAVYLTSFSTEEGAADASAALPIDALRAQGAEIIGPLSQFVRVDRNRLDASEDGEKVDRTIRQLVEKVILVRSFESCPFINEFLSNPEKVRELSESGFALVSLSGDVLEWGEGVSGARIRSGVTSDDQDATLLGRKRAIDELRSEVGQLDSLLEETKSKCEVLGTELRTLKSRLQELSTQLQSIEIESAGIDRDIHQSNLKLKDLDEQYQFVLKQREDLKEEAERSKKERVEAEEKIQEVISRRAQLEATVSESDGELEEREQRLREEESQLQELRIREASLRERLQSVRRENDAARAFIEDRNRRLAELDRTLERISQEKESQTGADSEILARIETITRGQSTQKEELSLVKDRLEQISAETEVGMRQIKSLHQRTEDKTARINELAIELEKISGEITHLVQNLEEKYGPGCLEKTPESGGAIQEEMTEPVVTAEMTEEEEKQLAEEVEKLRERIRRLGEVNTMAVEEFEELKKRHEYLSTERQDLEQSIQNLEDAIEHINDASVERFRQTFEAISNRFERLFPIIFGGGKAELSLVFPEGSTDILDAGVDILAQPPGKKVVNIGLLSGGEKALTAVSLIFAIFMVKPSPFCVLDEVDAPLDDANIGKFNALLKEMAIKTQFILITHNKKTMELNDTLYGVTMEEPGVSKMVSIEMS